MGYFGGAESESSIGFTKLALVFKIQGVHQINLVFSHYLSPLTYIRESFNFFKISVHCLLSCNIILCEIKY